MLPQHKHKNSLAVDRIDLPGKRLPQKREDFQQGQFTGPLYFTAVVMLIPQTSQSQVCCQEQLSTSRYSRGPSQFKPWTNPLSPPKVVYVKAEDTSDFHPSLRRYVLAWYKSVLEVWVKLAISSISYSTAVLFEEGCLPLATRSCPTSFSVCNTQPPTEPRLAETIQLKNSPERVGTSCWIHLNKDCQQKKHLPSHSFDLAHPGVWLGFTSFITGGQLYHQSLLN